MQSRFWGHAVDILTCDAAYWVVQNSVGIILPMLFVLIPAIKYPLACVGPVFFGITSQTMSSNTTIGGRIIGGTLLMGAVLSGGLLGFMIVYLSWLARGQTVEGLLDIYHKLNVRTFMEYFHDQGDFYDAIEIVYEDVKLILQANSKHVSTSFYVLALVLFGLLSVPWAWIRSVSGNPLKEAISLLGLSFTSVMTSFCLLMPITGQYAFWSLVYGGFLKACAVAMWGTIVSGLVIYVKSAHDELRKSLAGVMKDAGRTLAHVTSVMEATMVVVDESKVSLENIPLRTFSEIIEYDQVLRKTSVKNYLVMLKDLQAANTFLSSCKAEPSLPGLCSQWGTDVNFYAQVSQSIENVISQIGCMEVIYLSIKKGDLKNIGEPYAWREQNSWIFTQDTSIGLKLVQKVSKVCASMSAVLQGSSDALSRMPLFGPCSGNSITWRPQPREFWIDLYRTLFSIFEDDQMISYLQRSGIFGVREVLESGEQHGSMPFRLGGSSLVLITAVESMLDYCVQLDQNVAEALDISDYESFRTTDCYLQVVPPNVPGMPMSNGGKGRAMKTRTNGFRRSPIFKAFLLPVLIGSGILGWLTYAYGVMDIVKHCRVYLRKRSNSMQPRKDGPGCHDVIFFFKYWSAVYIALLIIILVGWVALQDSSWALYNDKQAAEYLLKWMPFNAPIAVAICMNPSIDASIVKIFLRSCFIAFGGVLGFVTMMNGYLAQNPYFIFFVVLMVNGFFSLFSCIDPIVRYSIFLTVYTYFSVVTCQYTGCSPNSCEPGNVWEFAGRTISTVAGAAFALLFHWLVVPVYSSQIIFRKENKLLDANMQTVEDCLQQAPKVLCQKPGQKDDVQTHDVEEDSLGKTGELPITALYDFISEKTTNSFKTRLTIVSDIALEKTEKSMDQWRIFFLYITLIPLPFACKLAFIRIARMGIQINVCMHALKTNVFPNDDGVLRGILLSTIMEDTNMLVSSTKDLCKLIAHCLLQTSDEENSRLEVRIKAARSLTADIRERLSKQYESTVGRINSKDISRRDLKCLVFLQYLYACLDEIDCLAWALISDRRMKIRDSYFTFVVALSRKEELVSLDPSDAVPEQ